MSADEILKLLAARHAEDVFVPECKSGATTAGYLRLDAWAMKRAWTAPKTWGYEIKVARGDFINDTKLQGYLPYCNELYVVCPKGLAAAEEVPVEAGLLWVVNGRLLVKKKAPHRQVQVPEALYRYILMYRAGAFCPNKDEESTTRQTDWRVQRWKDWLAKKEEERSIGTMVSKALRQRYDREVVEVRNENVRLRHQNELLQTTRDLVRQLTGGDKGTDVYRLQAILAQAAGAYTTAAEYLERARAELDAGQKQITVDANNLLAAGERLAQSATPQKSQ